MFELKKVPNRIVTLKLSTGDDIICNLIMCKGDVSKKDRILDPATGQECVVVSYPVRQISQINLTADDGSGKLDFFFVMWSPQSASRIYLLPTNFVVGLHIPSNQAVRRYMGFLKKFGNMNPNSKDEVENKEKTTKPDIKFMSPGPTEIQ